MTLAHLPGRTYNSLVEGLAIRLDSIAYSFTAGKRACDTANDLTERLDAILKDSLSGRYVPFNKYTLNQGRIIREGFSSIVAGIEKCTSFSSHSTSLQVIFMLATRFPNFHHYFFTDNDVIIRLLFDESKYNELITKKFGHKDQTMLRKLASITRLSLKDDVPSNDYARQLFLSLGRSDVLDPYSMVPVKMLQSASTYDQKLIALAHLREWILRLIKDKSEPAQATRPGIELVCELSEKLDTIITDPNHDPISMCLGSCVRKIFLMQEEGELHKSTRLEETLKRISLTQCYELAWHLSKLLWEQYQRILFIHLYLIRWDTKGMEKAEECVRIMRNTYAQAIDAMQH